LKQALSLIENCSQTGGCRFFLETAEPFGGCPARS
jgi:hypothetical protein